MLEFENSDAPDEFIEYNDFCHGFENPILEEVDEFSIIKEYINTQNLKMFLSLPSDPLYIKYNILGWHIAAAILGVGGHSLNKEASEELMERVLKENENVNEQFIQRERGTAYEIIGRSTFFYKKSLVNVLNNNFEIGQRLHPLFKNIFQHKGIGEKICNNFYWSIKYTSWIHRMGIHATKTKGRYSSVFFYRGD